MIRSVVAVVLAAVMGAGCGDCGRSERVPAAPSRLAQSTKSQTIAVVEGSVRLAEGSEPASYPAEGMEKKVLDHVASAPLPQACTPATAIDRTPVRLTNDGLLSGVVLAASQFGRQVTRPPRVHDVVIRDCRLDPALVVAMKGDTLRVRNDVDYPFMPAFGRQPVARTLTRGQTYDVVLDAQGVTPLLCGFTAACGRTDVVVMHHPYYAVTDATGNFRFESFPQGEPVVVSAWHPLYREAKQDVQVDPGEQKRLDFVLSPLVTPSAQVPGSARAKDGKAAPR